MFICTGCNHLWKIRLMACGRCQAPVRPFGSDGADFDHPAVSKFPLRRAMRRAGPVRPGSKSTVAVWRTYAVRVGVDEAALEGKTKTEIRALAEGVAA